MKGSKDPVARSLHWRRILVLLVVGTGLALMSLLVGYGLYIWTFLALPRHDERPPILIYGASLLLEPGMHLQEAHLKERLDGLGYHPVSSTVQVPGDYKVGEQFVDLYLHDLEEAHFKGFPLRLYLENNRVTKLLSLVDHEEVLPLPLEPPVVSGVRGPSRQFREWVPLSSIPQHVREAVVAIEDHRFYRHHGVDPQGVARALWANVKSGRIVQGGSTITQQLAKNLFYSHRRTWLRKTKEAVAAIVLEVKYSKDEILEAYLNEIYLGQAASVGIFGVGEAAERYLGKPLQDVTLAEGAMLAGLIKSPNTYSPWNNISAAKMRQGVVLQRLREEGLISKQDWEAAVGAPVRIAPAQESINDAPYFVDFLLTQAEATAGGAVPPGAKILSTLDPVLQRIADDTLNDGLRKLQSAHPTLTKKGQPLQGALLALDPRTGGILAMVGGMDYRHSQFNRVVQARRQPGSLFKALVYLAAFEARRSPNGEAMTPATLVLDEPVSFQTTGAASWSPQNYDRQFRGEVTMRTALEKSLNVPAVRVAQMVGVRRLIDMSRKLGIQGPIEENLSIALGTSEVSLLEITAAFGVLAQQGMYMSPTSIRGIVAPTGETLWFGLPERRHAVSAESAFLVSSLLKGAVERGTAARVKAMGVKAAVAGKTGTTDNYRDAWFVGYTPDLVIGVWVGFDDGSALGLTGAQAALPIWADFARQVIPSDSPKFAVPSGIVMREVDPQTGRLATSRCPQAFEEMFIVGTEPTDYCPLHGMGLWERIKQNLGL